LAKRSHSAGPKQSFYAGILATAARTCAADHTPPRGAEIARSFNSLAIERSEFAPALRMSSMTGARSAARDFAASDLARRALAQSAAVPPRPRKPPSRFVFVIYGVGERATAIALGATARWSFLLFWPAYAGGAIASLWPRLNRLARYGRELGLAYASAQLIHVGLVLWIMHVASAPGGAMVFFWIGIFWTYVLALFSLPQLQGVLGPSPWRVLRTIALEYIAIAFAADLITAHWQEIGRLSYLPFALMLVSGAGLRFVAFRNRRLRPLLKGFLSRASGSILLCPFGKMPQRESVSFAFILITRNGPIGI
jgi:hypothetical protein